MGSQRYLYFIFISLLYKHLKLSLGFQTKVILVLFGFQKLFHFAV